jgi:hypothetical protein
MTPLEERRMKKLQTKILLARERGDVRELTRLQAEYRAAGFPVTRLGGGSMRVVEPTARGAS